TRFKPTRATLSRTPTSSAGSPLLSINVGLRPTPRLGRSRGPQRPAPLPRRRARPRAARHAAPVVRNPCFAPHTGPTPARLSCHPLRCEQERHRPAPVVHPENRRPVQVGLETGL